MHLKFRASKYKYFCSAPQGLVKLQSRHYKITGSNAAPNQHSINLHYTSDSSGATSVLCRFKQKHNLANGAKRWINTRLSSLGGTHMGFIHPPSCAKTPASRRCWMMADARWHHPSRKIAPVCQGDTGEDALTHSFPADGGPPCLLLLSPAVLSCPPCQMWDPSLRGVQVWSHTSRTPMSFPPQLSAPTWAAICSRCLPVCLCMPGAPKRPAWRCSLASTLSNTVGRREVRSPRQHPAQGNAQTRQWLLTIRGRRAPDPACILRADPAWVNPLSCRKDCEAKGEPYQS